MSAAVYREHDNRAPALLAAAMLHGALLAAVVLLPSRRPLLPIGSSVPITLVTSQKATDTSAAIEAPQAEAAAAPVPTPQAPPQPPAPVVAPPAFSPTPTPKVLREKPVPPQPAQRAAPAQKPIDFNHLQSIIANAQRTSAAAASSAQAGPARAQTAPQARPDVGHGLSQNDQLGLQQLLERLWNPNCDVPGGDAVRLQVKFRVGLGGKLVGAPTAGGAERSADAVVAAAARRAIDAVSEAEPYAEPYYEQSIVVNFDAREACAKR